MDGPNTPCPRVQSLDRPTGSCSPNETMSVRDQRRGGCFTGGPGREHRPEYGHRPSLLTQRAALPKNWTSPGTPARQTGFTEIRTPRTPSCQRSGKPETKTHSGRIQPSREIDSLYLVGALISGLTGNAGSSSLASDEMGFCVGWTSGCVSTGAEPQPFM